MADVIAKPTTEERRETSRAKRRRDDLWVAATGLIAAMLALPFAQSSWHGPEVAAVLAVAATALLAGQRWAISVIVIAELLLMPTIGPRAFLADGELMPRIAALSTMLLSVPGLLSMRRAAAALVLVLVGESRTRHIVRRVHVGL